MFGAPATSPFGAPAPAPFGAPATPFGAPAPAFGAPATSAFGAPAPAFGAPATPAFGAPATGFGAPAPSAFGAPAPSVFGAPAPATGGFGAPAAPAFGAPAPAFGAAPATGLFGAPAPAAGGFGMKPASGGLFGAAPTPAPSTSIFGAPAPATGGLFGAPAPAPTGSIFGAPPAAPAFGSPAPAFGAAPAPAFGAPATSPFGAAPTTQTSGTAAVPFQAQTKQDGTNTITLHSITAMSQYEGKSFEELRLEDYLAGNKGTMGHQQAPAAGGFGGFGAAPQPAPATGLFGAPAAAPTGGGLFGAPAPAAGGLFGSAPAAPATGGFGGFGAAPAPAFGAAPAPATGLFGAPAAAPKPGGLFGSPAPAPAFGAPATGFGTTLAPAFGAAPAPATGLFGAPAAAPKPGGLFGAPAPAPTGLFGAAPAPAAGGLFGTPAPAAGGLFGAPAPAPAGGLFGAPAAPAPAMGGGLFGAPAAPATPAAGGGLFGTAATPAPFGGLFGAPAPAPTSLFGAPAAAPVGGLFGSPPATMPQPVAAAPVAPTPSADVLLAQQLAAVENQKKQLELTEAWRGNPPSGAKVIASSLYDDTDRSWNSYAAQSSALMSYRAAPRSAAKIRPRGFTPTKLSPVSAAALKNGASRSGGSPILSPNCFIGSATKSLIIKPGSLTPKPKTRLLLTNGLSSQNTDPSVANLENGRFESPRTLQYPTQDLQSPSPTAPKPVDSVSPNAGTPSMNGNSPAHDFYRQVVGSPDEAVVGQASASPAAAKIHVPTLTKAGYVVYPPFHDLEAMSEADLATVSDFKVERPGYGSVEWDGAVDVRGVDLDSTVVIESKNVSVYDDAELNGNKPKQGSKLNRPAVITMFGIYPKAGSGASSEAKEKFIKKIEKTTKKMGADLISFDADRGEWKFRVGHFSRYGLDDDSDEESDDDDVNATPSLTTVDDEEKNELGGASKLHAPSNEDESTSGSAFTDDIQEADENEEEMDILRDGDEAYTIMMEELVEYEDALELQPLEYEHAEEKLLFPNEAADEAVVAVEHITPTSTRESISSNLGICSKLAKQCGLAQPSSSSVDYGFRMRRSFRVGWRPDGSFLQLKPTSDGGKILVQSRPVISGDKSNPVLLLQTHRRHSVTVEVTDDDAPLFTLPQSDNSSESNRALFTAVKHYADSSTAFSSESAVQKAVTKAFALMTCLYGDDETDTGTRTSSRRLEAVSSWLKEVASEDVSEAIEFGKLRGDIYGSIFSALSGGDFSAASSLALDRGHLRLAVMLASSGVSIQPLYESQLETWNETSAQRFVPGGLLRIFSLARGSMDTEESIFKSDPHSYSIDWRRRFGMYLWLCRKPQEEESISTLVRRYTTDVSNGVAPPPTPLYVDEMKNAALSKTNSKCILYQILNSYSNAAKTSPADIVDPHSHTPFSHDYSASYHLAACIAALTSSSLTLNQEDLVIDALSSQLIMCGSWEWAVYATLSVIGNKIPISVVASRRIRAKDMISRLYTPYHDSKAGARRSFLESLGVPSEWFSAATAYRSAHEGNVQNCVESLVHFSVNEATSAMESMIIPHYILGGKECRYQLMHILHTAATFSDEHRNHWDASRLCGLIYEFLCLSKEVEDISTVSLEGIEEWHKRILGMIEHAANLQHSLTEYRDSCKEQAPLAKIPSEFTLTPRHVFLSEVCTMLSHIHMQLLALNNGKTVKDECSSEVVFALSSDSLFGTGEAPGDAGSILRGMCGFNA